MLMFRTSMSSVTFAILQCVTFMAILHYTMPQVVDARQHATPSYLLEPISMSKTKWASIYSRVCRFYEIAEVSCKHVASVLYSRNGLSNFPQHCISLYSEMCIQTSAPLLVWWNNKIASLSVAPRPPMTDVGTETAFRLDQRKHFRKSEHILRSEVSWCALHLRRSTWHCTSEKIDQHA